MAKNDNLNDFLADVANAIRLKKGTSDLINPQDFSTEIESISGSGGGESSIEYLDVRNVTTLVGGAIPLRALLGSMGYAIKFKNPNNDSTTLLSCAALYTSFPTSQIPTLEYYEVEIDFSGIYGGNSNEGIRTNYDAILSFGVTKEQLDSIPRITKEQFYSLE